MEITAYYPIEADSNFMQLTSFGYSVKHEFKKYGKFHFYVGFSFLSTKEFIGKKNMAVDLKKELLIK